MFTVGLRITAIILVGTPSNLWTGQPTASRANLIIQVTKTLLWSCLFEIKHGCSVYKNAKIELRSSFFVSCIHHGCTFDFSEFRL